FADPSFQGQCVLVSAATPALGAVGMDNQVSSIQYRSDCPGTLPETIAGKPAAVAMGSTHIEVFARTPDNKLWHRAWLNRNWQNPEVLDGNFIGSPSVASWGANRIDVFARSTDNALLQKWYDGTWHDWVRLTGANTLNSDPAAVSWGANRIDIFYRSFP